MPLQSIPLSPTPVLTTAHKQLHAHIYLWGVPSGQETWMTVKLVSDAVKSHKIANNCLCSSVVIPNNNPAANTGGDNNDDNNRAVLIGVLVPVILILLVVVVILTIGIVIVVKR